MKNRFNDGGSKKLNFFERLVGFADWCDSHGVFKFLADIVLKIVFWYLTNKK